MNPAELRRGIGKHLSTFQQSHRYSQSDVADLLDIGAPYYNRLLFGTGSLSFELLCRIAEVTGMEPWELLLPIESEPDITKRWRVTDVAARLDNVKAIVMLMERQAE